MLVPRMGAVAFESIGMHHMICNLRYREYGWQWRPVPAADVAI